MRSVRFAKLFSLPLSCSKSVDTVCVAVWKGRRVFSRRWITEETLFGYRSAIRIGAGRNLPKQFGEERIQFRDLDRTFAVANIHLNQVFPLLRAEGTRAV